MKKLNKKRVAKKSVVSHNRKFALHKKFIKMLKNNRLALAIFVLLAIAAAVIGFLFVQKYTGDTAIQGQNPVITKANSLKSQAIELLHSNPSKAKTLFIQAREKYQAVSDKNNIIDVEAQLYLIDHVYKTK